MRKVTLLMSKQTAENQTNKHHQVQNLVKRVALGGFCTASLPTSLCFNHLLSRLLQRTSLRASQTSCCRFTNSKPQCQTKVLRVLCFLFTILLIASVQTVLAPHRRKDTLTPASAAVTLAAKSYPLSQISLPSMLL